MALRFRHRGWYGVIFVVVLIVWLNKGLPTPIRTKTNPIPIPRDPSIHPIAQLTARAKLQWEEKLNGQSKTLAEAVKEYKRRYGRKPPKGFDQWYAWATEHGLKLVDEFDAIHDNLLPFWGLSPAQIDARKEEMIKLARSDRLFTLEIRNGELYDDPAGLASTKRWPINKHYYALLNGISQFLPDMALTINLYDVPLVFVSLEERERLIALGKAGKFATDEEHLEIANQFDRRTSDMSVKDLQRSCPPGSALWKYTTTDTFGEDVLSPAWEKDSADLSFRLPKDMGGFIHDHNAAMDLCNNPELQWQHGKYLSPVLLNLGFKRNYLYPVFSWTRYPRSADVLIPTSYRFEHNKPQPGPWEKRIPKIVWRGTLTGMDAVDDADTFASQRFRLCDMMVRDYDQVPILSYTNTSGYSTSTLRAGPLNEEWMNVGVRGNHDWMRNSKAADVAVTKFAFQTYMSGKERNEYKVLLDVDGWGWSARFRELLWTGGAVLKATIFHEATTDWLVPWYHYIPLDYAYRDLYSIALYYLGLEGTDHLPRDDEMREMGEHSRQWVDDHAQWDHHLAYMYRLCLEWARVMSDRSPEWDYQG